MSWKKGPAPEVVTQWRSVKRVFLEISQNSLENTCGRVSFLIKLQTFDLARPGTVGEIIVLIKFSPKRGKMLGSLIENVLGVKENETVCHKEESLNKLCATCWRVRARCLQKIITHYSSIQHPREK